MTPPRERQRRSRKLRRLGKVSLRIDVDRAAWPLTLAAGGFLRHEDLDNIEAVRRATEKYIERTIPSDIYDR